MTELTTVQYLESLRHELVTDDYLTSVENIAKSLHTVVQNEHSLYECIYESLKELSEFFDSEDIPASKGKISKLYHQYEVYEKLENKEYDLIPSNLNWTNRFMELKYSKKSDNRIHSFFFNYLHHLRTEMEELHLQPVDMVKSNNELVTDNVNTVSGYAKSIGGKIIDENKPEGANFMVIGRQSVYNGGSNSARHFDDLATLEKRAELLNYTAHSLYVSDLSGSFMYKLVNYVMKETNYKGLMVDAVDRLSRNVLEGIAVLKWAHFAGFKIYEHDMLITEGNGYFQAVIKLIFAEFELLGKQRVISKYMRRYAEYIIETQELSTFDRIQAFKELDEKTQKLAEIVQWKGIEKFYQAFANKAKSLVHKYDEEGETEKADKRMEDYELFNKVVLIKMNER